MFQRVGFNPERCVWEQVHGKAEQRRGAWGMPPVCGAPSRVWITSASHQRLAASSAIC